MKEDDHEEYVLPPVELPRIPDDPNKNESKILLNIEDWFKEEITKVDESSI